MKQKFMGLVLAAVVLASGCAHLEQEVRSTPQNVFFSLEQAVEAFDHGDLALSRELLEDALEAIPKQNYEMQNKVLIGLAYVNLYQNNMEEVVKLSRQIQKVSKELDERKVKRDPQVAVIHAIAAINTGGASKARAILDDNETLKWTSIKSLMLEEVR